LVPITEVPGLDLTFVGILEPISLGLGASIGLSGGSFALDYPIDASIVLPGNVRPGDSFVIDTNLNKLANPQLTIDGPGLEFVAETYFSGLSLSAELIGSVLGFDLGADIDLSLLETRLQLFDLSEFNIFEGSQKLFGDALNLRYDIDLDSLDQTATLAYSGVSLQQISNVLATPSTPWLAVDWDVDDSFLDLKALDNKIKIPGGFELEYSAASINVIGGLSPYLKASTNITGVEVELALADGRTQTGMLGDAFVFTLPANYSESSLGLTASYKLLGEVHFEFGMVNSLGFKVELGGFSLQTPISELVDVTLLEFSGNLLRRFDSMYAVDIPLEGMPIISQSYSVAVSSAAPTDEVIPEGAPSATPTVAARVVGYTAEPISGTLAFMVSEGNIPENTIVFRVERSENLTGTTQVDYSFTFGAGLDADDFVGGRPNSGTLTFAPGQSSKDILVRVAGDTTAEANELLTLSLSATEAFVNAPQTRLFIASDDGLRIDTNGFAQGTEGSDLIVGGTGPDEIYAGPGNDTISSGGEYDTIVAGSGDDVITVGHGGTVDGGSGVDRLVIDGTPFSGGESMHYRVSPAEGSLRVSS
jgi:Ca2+-binding RTX toxin-like protein